MHSLATLLILLLCVASTGAQAASLCVDTALQAAPRVRALVMAAAAQQEHVAFGGQTMDAQGRLTESGSNEAEDTGRPAPWQRVLSYWQAVDPTGKLPSRIRFGALRPADRTLLREALNQATAARLQGLGVGQGEGLSSSELRASLTALDRVAVIDTPWSAVFVSWLARQARLRDDEFVFSDAHADYAGAAWKAGIAEAAGRPTRSALRACDVTTTPPRIGDLVCQARGAGAGLDTFDKIGEVLADRETGGAPLPMHCDVVVVVDATGFDTIGGNVLQSVTRQRLDFAPGTRRLDPSYLPGACVAGAPGCIDRHMGRQPWSLLLQWR